MTANVKETGNRWIWPFELLERIGEGGMGVVYRARYVVNDRQVAVKMLPDDITDTTVLKRFEREVEVLKSLKHPNIVRCFGGKCEDDQRFYAMELVEGGTLDEVLRRKGRLSWEQVIEYGLQMCAALECSHAAGVIHRDVKPANFLIGKDGQLKLSDFGIATMIATRKITAAGKTLGTYHYMAPEQIRGATVNARTDLYALGCMFFEMLSGKPPFLGDTPAEILQKHVSQEPPRLAREVLDCPITLERIIYKLLEKEPDKRPTSAAEVAGLLRGVSQTVEVVAPTRKQGLRGIVSNQPLTSTGDRTKSAPQDKTEVSSSGDVPGWSLGLLGGLLLIAVVALFAQHGLIGEMRTGERLWIDAAQRADINTQETALEALGVIAPHNPEAMEVILDQLMAEDARLRIAAVEASGKTGNSGRRLLPELIKIQKNDPDGSVRSAAGAAITRINESPMSRSWGTYAFALLLLTGIGAAVYYFWPRTTS